MPPGDSRAIASSLNTVLGDPALAAAMGDMARRRVEEEYELNARVLTEIRIYEDFLAGRK